MNMYIVLEVLYLKKINVGQLIGEIVIGIIVVALLCTILIPSISRCFENAAVKVCRKDMNNIMATLEAQLNSNAEPQKWKQLLNEKKSQQLLSELVNLMSEDKKPENISDYYFFSEGNELKLICKKHDKIDDISITLPQEYLVERLQTTKTAQRLRIDGIKNYAKGAVLDSANAQKTVFAEGEDVSAYFSDIEVSLAYVDGTFQALNPVEYKITAENIDMSKTGEQRINVSYTAPDSVWTNSINAGFTFEVIERSECPPLAAVASKERYEVEAWNWNDFVTALNSSEKESKSFGAALIFFDNKYYYYPEGFSISKSNDNSSPLNAAADKSSKAMMAEYIEILSDKVVSQKAKKLDEGALTVINGEIHTYKKPTRSDEGGWIKIYSRTNKTAIAEDED